MTSMRQEARLNQLEARVRKIEESLAEEVSESDEHSEGDDLGPKSVGKSILGLNKSKDK